MNNRRIQYMLDGDTFVGRYRLTNTGPGPAVSVQFENMTRTASLGAQSEQLVARALLGQLVREHVTSSPRSLRDARG